MWTRESSGDGEGVKKKKPKPNSNDKHRSKFHNETYYLIHKSKIEFSKQLSVLATFLWSCTWVAVVTESGEDHLWVGLIN